MFNRIFIILCILTALSGSLSSCFSPAKKTDSVSNNPDSAAAEKAVRHDPLPDGFVLVKDVVPSVIEEIRYYGTYNFVGTRIDGYQDSCAILTRQAAEALKAVSEELAPKGYCLKIYDAYRPQQAVKHFVRWSKNLADTTMKRHFYPNLEKGVLFQQGYIAHKSGHSRGSTVDLSLARLANGEDVDMGGGFDYLDPSSHPDNRKGITDEQFHNRMLLRDVMVKHGFKPMSTEWWHFTLRNEPYPNTYFDFPVHKP